MKERIVVVGGYGHVGKLICKELGECYPGKVYAAGRSFDHADRFSRSTGGKIRPMQLNIGEKFDPGVLNNVKLIIMCLDQTNPAFVQSCLQQGIYYVDISANYSFLSQVERLQTEALANRSTAVLSVGLAPGLTNLMALYAKGLMDQTDAIDISIMLGLGDQHGKAAVEWTIDNLDTKYDLIQNGNHIEAASFTEGKATDFGERLGRKKAYRFNFSDQHTLPRTLGVPSVSTRLCFDSAAVTGLLAWFRASGIFRFLKFTPIRNTVVKLFGKLRYGEEIFAVKIDAWGKKNHGDVLVECFVQGKNEAEITAKAAAAVAAAVYRSSFAHGIYHIEQLFELKDILQYNHQSVSFQVRMTTKPFPPLPA
ncbi:saccharopine dehydrogenase family protein [Paenibacillus durus]|nr:saccharopine dehydrogenase NADP-binding domain-containing protein [Paenibacillus durus]